MAYFLFIDESGHDRGGSPYEVLAGIAVKDTRLWPLITELADLELRHFGIRYRREKHEIKGKKFLKRKVFRLAAQVPHIAEAARLELARSCLLDGADVGRLKLTALAQAKLEFVRDVFSLCAQHRCHAFASIVDPNSPNPDNDVLRKDYSYLFERFFYFLEDKEDQQGIIVFDELDKSQSHILLGQMEAYFLNTGRGQERSGLIIPEPLFVHSDLSSLIQVTDLAAYVISWAWRSGSRMTERVREELSPYAEQVAGLRYLATRNMLGNPYFQIWSFNYIDDLRCQAERECEI